MKQLGVHAQTISFAGGAGGANADATTPRATVRLLQALSKRDDFPVILAGLPVLGVDGTLVDVLGPRLMKSAPRNPGMYPQVAIGARLRRDSAGSCGLRDYGSCGSAGGDDLLRSICGAADALMCNP